MHYWIMKVNAEEYKCSSDHKGYRFIHYQKKFQTAAGDVTLNLNIPKLKGIPFEMAVTVEENVLWKKL